MLGTARRLADKGEADAAGEGIDRRRLAGVGAPGEGDLAHGILRQISEVGDSRQERRLLEQRHKKLSKAAKAAEN